MTLEDVKKYAMQNYNNGGDVIIECWSDDDIRIHILDADNPMDVLNSIISVQKEQCDAARCLSGCNNQTENMGRTEDVKDKQMVSEEKEEDERHISCSVCGDYSPSAPWLAPGMSISDFI